MSKGVCCMLLINKYCMFRWGTVRRFRRLNPNQNCLYSRTLASRTPRTTTTRGRLIILQKGLESSHTARKTNHGNESLVMNHEKLIENFLTPNSNKKLFL